MFDKLKSFISFLVPDFIENWFKEKGWQHKGTIETKQYVERIHGDNDGSGGDPRIKDGVDDNKRFIDMTTVNVKNTFSKDNVVNFDEEGNFGINADVTTSIGAGLYRGDTTGKNEKHDFARLAFPYIHAGVEGEATVAYNGDERFKPEVGIRAKGEFQGRLYGEVDAIARVSSQITDKDKVSAYYAKSLHAGAYYPISIGGMEKGYNPYGKGDEIGIGYERKLDNGNSIEVEAYYRNIQASMMKNDNSYEPDNVTAGLRVSFRH